MVDLSEILHCCGHLLFVWLCTAQKKLPCRLILFRHLVDLSRQVRILRRRGWSLEQSYQDKRHCCYLRRLARVSSVAAGEWNQFQRSIGRALTLRKTRHKDCTHPGTAF